MSNRITKEDTDSVVLGDLAVRITKLKNTDLDYTEQLTDIKSSLEFLGFKNKIKAFQAKMRYKLILTQCGVDQGCIDAVANLLVNKVKTKC